MWQAGVFLGFFGVCLELAGLWTRSGHDGLIWRPYMKPKGKDREAQLVLIGNWVMGIGLGLITLGLILALLPD